ncbi:clathrin light chain-like [Ornithodoros turicata]|uniref:clathrin light chain-like n=1 Tax=Ornithodoros turicata TaxID=34597 RepID=UPI003138DE18
MSSSFEDDLMLPQGLPAATTDGNPFIDTTSVEEQPGDVDDFAFDRFSTPVKEADDSAKEQEPDGGPPVVCSNDGLLADFADVGAMTAKADEQPVVRQDSLVDAFGEVPQGSLEGSSAREQDITVSIDSEEDPARDFIERERELLASFNESSVESVVDSTSPFAQSSGMDGSSFDGTPSRGTSHGPSPIPAAASGVKEVPEPVRRAQDEMRERLVKKDSEEASRILELNETARQELEDWYARYHEQLGKTKARNKETQNVFVEERDRGNEKGKEWESLGNMCNFSSKGYRGTKDVSRMRSILMQLKQKPPAVPVSE